MCELLGLSSNLRAAVSLSLAELAEHGRPPGLSADGCGVAYYEESDARLIKDSVAAVDSDWIGFLERHEVRSSIVLAHTVATISCRSPIGAATWNRKFPVSYDSRPLSLLARSGRANDANKHQLSQRR